MKLHPFETVIEIDAASRMINIPEALYEIGVAGDHYAETIYFKIDRYYDEMDLSTVPCIIDFVNAAGANDTSAAVEVEVSDDYITFGWEIDKRVTIASGIITFCVNFISEEGRGYKFCTLPAELKIKDGLLDSAKLKTITNEDLAFIQQMQSQISILENSLALLENRISAIIDNSAENTNNIADIKNDIARLKDNVVYNSKILYDGR